MKEVNIFLIITMTTKSGIMFPTIDLLYMTKIIAMSEIFPTLIITIMKMLIFSTKSYYI